VPKLAPPPFFRNDTIALARVRNASGASGLTDSSVYFASADLVSNVVLKPGSDSPERVAPPVCLEPFVHGFAAGAVTITLTATTEEAGAGGAGSEPSLEVSLDCHATVEPGRLVQATCP